MILEALVTNCFACSYVLKINTRPLGKFSVLWTREGYKIQLLEGRRLQFRKIGWLTAGQYELVDLPHEEVLAHCDRNRLPLFSISWNLHLNTGTGQLVSKGWLDTAYEFIREDIVLARVDRMGRHDRGWYVDGSDVLSQEDLLMIGLVFHTLHRRYYYRRNEAGGNKAET